MSTLGLLILLAEIVAKHTLLCKNLVFMLITISLYIAIEN